MKEKKKKNIKTIANEIIKLEEQCQSGTNISENMDKIEQLIIGLSLKEMLEIDEYIMLKKLTK